MVFMGFGDEVGLASKYNSLSGFKEQWLNLKHFYCMEGLIIEVEVISELRVFLVPP